MDDWFYENKLQGYSKAELVGVDIFDINQIH